jgi:hypothetical protein
MWFWRNELQARFHPLASHQSIELRGGVPLCYADFNKPVLFHPYTDASDYQLGAVIMQDKSL